MKTKLALFTLSLAATLAATEAPQPACCCAVERPGAVTPPPAVSLSNPLTAKSLYQLDAQWTNDAGEIVSLAAFRGQPVIAVMFFAQCEYACPMLVNDVRRVREQLAPAVREKARVVLVSFDVKRDTPTALKAYRERANLDAHWTLLHGDTAAVQDLAMLLGVKFKQDERGQFAHSNLITVLNAEGEIVKQRAGLQGDVSELAAAVTAALPAPAKP